MKFKTALVGLSLAGASLALYAQTSNGASAAEIARAASTDTALTDGEVRKIDKENRKITVKHGEIKNLDMPGMTMVFQVKDAAVLDTVKPGDKVQFRAERAAGALVVTELQPAK